MAEIRPTTLKLHDFPEESFINGCYIPDQICDDLIQYYEDNPDRHTMGQVYGIGDRMSEVINDKDVMDSTGIGFSIYENPEDARALSEYLIYLELSIKEYEYKYHQAGHIANYGITELINLQTYDPGGGFKTWHCERSGITQQTRCLVFMTYLNDVEDGGTEFMYQKMTSPAIKGLTLIWPSDWTHTHRGQISKEHKKKVITGWLNYTA